MEESVGRLWHRFITGLAERRSPQAAAILETERQSLAIFFRGLGGDPGLAIAAAESRTRRSRRRWLERLAGTGIAVTAAWMDDRALYLPPVISLFPRRELNRNLYYWLAALAAAQRDLAPQPWLQHNRQAAAHVLAAWPGLRRPYNDLAAAHLAQRPNPAQLDSEAAALERLVRQALTAPNAAPPAPEPEPAAIRPPAPVPLWLYPAPGAAVAVTPSGEDAPAGTGAQRQVEDMPRRRARRVDTPRRGRGLAALRMDNLLSWGEFVQVDRDTEEEENLEDAESAARDMDTLAVARQRRTAAARLKFDLELPAEADDDLVIADGLYLPEWDWERRRLQPEHCRVVELLADDAPPTSLPQRLAHTAARLRRQFQALRPARTWRRAQQDGAEADVDACLHFICERASGNDAPADRLYRAQVNGGRSLACLLLADLSMSTDTYVDDKRRVLDVIRDSLFLFAESLAATGDAFSMYGFSSRKRDPLRIHRLKDFAEPCDQRVLGRINAVKPGYFTRMGGGIRYAAEQLRHRHADRRLLLLLTDGKPNDLDKYEGRYGVEDTRRAVQEARRQGLHPFCVTIDRKGNDYLPHIFGAQGYTVISNPHQLPRRLPLLYAGLTSA